MVPPDTQPEAASRPGVSGLARRFRVRAHGVYRDDVRVELAARGIVCGPGLPLSLPKAGPGSCVCAGTGELAGGAMTPGWRLPWRVLIQLDG